MRLILFLARKICLWILVAGQRDRMQFVWTQSEFWDRLYKTQHIKLINGRWKFSLGFLVSTGIRYGNSGAKTSFAVSSQFANVIEYGFGYE